MANDWRETVDAVIALQSDEMKTDPGPSLQWYPQQWLGDPAVQLMGMMARGCHHHLLMVAWKGFDLDRDPVPCSLPDDLELLGALCLHPADWDQIWVSVSRAWRPREGRLWSLGLCRSYLHQMNNRRGAKKAAHARWGKAHTVRIANASDVNANASDVNANASDAQCTSAPSSTPTSGYSQEEPEARARDDNGKSEKSPTPAQEISDLLGGLVARGVQNAHALWKTRMDNTDNRKKPNQHRQAHQIKKLTKGLDNGKTVSDVVEMLEAMADGGWGGFQWDFDTGAGGSGGRQRRGSQGRTGKATSEQAKKELF